MTKPKCDRMTRIGLISDVHCGPNRETRVGEQAIREIEAFVSSMNDGFRPDVVIELGDRVLDVDKETDLANQVKVQTAFRELECPVIHVLGNHDMVHLSAVENEAIFGQVMHCASVDIAGVHIAILNTCDPVIDGIGGHVSQEQLKWLKSDLTASKMPTVIACHHALGYQDISTNWLFHSVESLAYVDNRDEVWEVISRHKQVLAVFNGHLHWSSMEVVGCIPVFSVDSPVDTWRTSGTAPGSYAEAIVFQSGQIEVKAKGLADDTFQYNPNGSHTEEGGARG